MVGGGSEILQLMKDQVVTPDYVVNLKTIPGLNTIKEERGGFRIGGLTQLADIEEHPEFVKTTHPVRCRRGSGFAANPQRRHHRRQYLPAAFLLVFPFF